MAKIINPVLVSQYGLFGSTKVRFYSLLSPIQETKNKHSDFMHYLARPFIDVAVLPVFLFDAAVALVNTLASLLTAIHFWASGTSPKFGHDKNEAKMIKANAREQAEEAKQQLFSIISAVVAAFVNPVLSILELITRPIASVVHVVADLCRDNGNYSVV